MPEKRPPDLRARDFDEIYAEYAREKAGEQASRCSQCGVVRHQAGGYEHPDPIQQHIELVGPAGDRQT